MAGEEAWEAARDPEILNSLGTTGQADHYPFLLSGSVIHVNVPPDDGSVYTAGMAVTVPPAIQAQAAILDERLVQGFDGEGGDLGTIAGK